MSRIEDFSKGMADHLTRKAVKAGITERRRLARFMLAQPGVIAAEWEGDTLTVKLSPPLNEFEIRVGEIE